MKIPELLPIFLLLIFTACNQESSDEVPPTIIKGKIIYSINPSDYKLSGVDSEAILERKKRVGIVTNAIRNGLETPNHQTICDADSNFQFTLKINQPTELRLQFYRKDVPIYAEPGDEITINIDLTKPKHPHTIHGDNAEISQLFSDYNQLLRDSFYTELNATLPFVIPREFKAQRGKITKRIRRATLDFIKKYAKDKPLVANWVVHHSEYRLAMDYLKYAFKVYEFNQFSPALKDEFPEAYFDFWETFPVNYPSAITSLNYQNYLQFYRKYLMEKLRQTTVYQDCVAFPNCNQYEMEITQLSDQLEGKIKDLLLAQQVDYHLTRNDEFFIKSGFNLYLNEIVDSTIIEAIQKRKTFLYADRAYEFPKNATLLQTDGNGVDILQNIRSRHPDKNILLYFWNTQREVSLFHENTERMQQTWKKLDSLDFDLVMLAHHSAPNIWKEKIVDKGLIEDQWHLTDEQYTYFENAFHNIRKPHVFYDKIRDRENFILLLDSNGNFRTLDAIWFRERTFFTVNRLPQTIKSDLAWRKRQQISILE